MSPPHGETNGELIEHTWRPFSALLSFPGRRWFDRLTSLSKVEGESRDLLPAELDTIILLPALRSPYGEGGSTVICLLLDCRRLKHIVQQQLFSHIENPVSDP